MESSLREMLVVQTEPLCAGHRSVGHLEVSSPQDPAAALQGRPGKDGVLQDQRAPDLANKEKYNHN